MFSKSLLILNFCIICFTLYSCGNTNPDNVDVADENDSLSFWSPLVKKDSLIWEKETVLDQEMSNYIYSLSNLDSAEIVKSIQNARLLLGDSTHLYKFWDKLDHYAYHPNSPIRNDEVSLILFQELVNIPNIKESYKIKYNRIISLLKRNRVGYLATDFQYVDDKGGNNFLKEIVSPYLILIFYDPNCHLCNEVIDNLQRSMLLYNSISNKKIKVLTVNIISSAVKKPDTNYGENWINGIDASQSILKKGFYNILAYPTIYILDEDKRVVLKDINLKGTLEFLQTIS